MDHGSGKCSLKKKDISQTKLSRWCCDHGRRVWVNIIVSISFSSNLAASSTGVANRLWSTGGTCLLPGTSGTILDLHLTFSCRCLTTVQTGTIKTGVLFYIWICYVCWAVFQLRIHTPTVHASANTHLVTLSLNMQNISAEPVAGGNRETNVDTSADERRSASYFLQWVERSMKGPLQITAAPSLTLKEIFHRALFSGLRATQTLYLSSCNRGSVNSNNLQTAYS